MENEPRLRLTFADERDSLLDALRLAILLRRGDGDLDVVELDLDVALRLAVGRDLILLTLGSGRLQGLDDLRREMPLSRGRRGERRASRHPHPHGVHALVLAGRGRAERRAVRDLQGEAGLSGGGDRPHHDSERDFAPVRLSRERCGCRGDRLSLGRGEPASAGRRRSRIRYAVGDFHRHQVRLHGAVRRRGDRCARGACGLCRLERDGVGRDHVPC